ncbi:hypothetical protein U3516DRAFT_735774 [Neocallimastix sp. 'constans']
MLIKTWTITPFKICEKINTKYGADINKENEDGETPLLKAFRNRNKDLVEYLIEHGGDIIKEKWSVTPSNKCSDMNWFMKYNLHETKELE